MRTRTIGPTSTGGTFVRRRNYWWYIKRSNLTNYQLGQTTDAAPGITMPRAGTYLTMSDEVTPGFERIRDSGGIVNTPMSKTFTYWTAQSSSFQSYFRLRNPLDSTKYYRDFHNEDPNIQVYSPIDLGLSSGFSVEGFFEPANVPSVTILTPANQEDLCGEDVTKAWANLADAPLSVWVIVGEFNETLQTVVWIFQRLKEVINLFKGRLPPNVRKHWYKLLRSGYKVPWDDVIQDASKAWLQMRYGIRPLVYDLLGALKAFEKLGNEARHRFSSHTDAVETGDSGILYTNQNCLIVHKCTVTSSLETSAGVLAEPIFDKQNILTLLGLGEVVKGTWDLIPFSFVIDWFLNVGDTLTSWAPNGLIEPLASWATAKQELVIDHSMLPVGGTPSEQFPNGWPNYGGITYPNWGTSYSLYDYRAVVSQLGYARKTVKRYIRVPEPPRPVVPTFQWNMNTAKAVDLLALVKNLRWFGETFKF